jgi:bifunctional non-homologous end joining protein LigD
MSLEHYQKRRDFKKTKEPKGKTIAAHKKANIFVVQKHAASHLHYDFRLAIDGVLKSWAIPKGPSLNPKEKRLAVMTEDHPLEYATFEGVIPEGEYGAGTVEIWDHGTWEAISLEKNKLHFRLFGKKLHGEWVLLKFANSQKNWLLIKVEDYYAKK